jgi:hypothetical protein
VRVFSVSGGTALPPGFSGVSSVVASGTGAGTAVAGAATAGGGISGTTLAIVGAVAVGIGTVVLVTKGENPPASPSR